jgi:hypothetical protein
LHLFPKVIAEYGIAVSEQVTRELVELEGLPKLLSGPCRRWVGGHVEVKCATTVMGQYQEDVQYLKADCGHSEEIDGDQR